MATRIGVDIGGTFTDLVYFDEATGKTVEGKVPTVPSAPEEGVVAAITGHVPQEIIEKAEFFLHGTTVGLNALLERRGSKVGLITTQGFRDVLEIRRGDRAEMYNLFWKQTEPLVPRSLRLEVTGRMLGTGAEYIPLDEDTVRAAVAQLIAAKVDAIAVSLINAYANPAHELRVAEIIAEAGFTGGVSLSHKISGEYREYERTSTTCIDAFVRGRMANYLRRLDGKLRELGFKGTSLITRSGSGSMTFAEAEDRPFETIMSGPVGGAQGAAELAKILNIKALVTADVGGTSFDTALVIDGKPQVLFEGVIDNMPIQSPWVDVRSIGSGGGSIAHIDPGGLMRVGPRSAAAVPGPACYGKGGVEPAMTDAAAWLGMLGPGDLASGITLDIGKAKAALDSVGQHIGQDAEHTAAGVMRISSAAMANAMREISLDQGLDPRTMTLLPFGGAGPLMGTLLADELGMNQIIIPPLAGNFSAWGLLGADMVQSTARTRVMDFAAGAAGAINATLTDLFSALETRSAAHADEAVKSARLDLRYKGQEHTLSIEVATQGGALAEAEADILNRFVSEYARTFGGTMNQDVELVSIRANTTVPLPQRQLSYTPKRSDGADDRVMDVYSFERQTRLPFRIIPRGRITGKITGPAIVTEDTTTTYVDADWTITNGSAGEIILERIA
ncbi:hydantoinase/oxoprolinase family protein [Ketogulonicigenium vulgare]|uniref:5-oxoprolinase (ATP-hydrolyzing) n=1 Tax=Ketogulonicigenium vulgare (strain WSH-001) TaxID=759362 RepID=F9YBG9_KETVW|nr:hydantoinase/oxoprolinase family protein [Ketogulonicigenium vulgare]AEM42721.1 5-oxoprolinase (ATP-hydrolyzing) [Ketogulonicigenium vulgare WSH-001]ALJ82830.1 5-oxoprolinase [Ketogulonicigenium vulgare]